MLRHFVQFFVEGAMVFGFRFPQRVLECAAVSVRDVSLGNVLSDAFLYGKMFLDTATAADWSLETLCATVRPGIVAAEDDPSFRLTLICMVLGTKRVFVPAEMFESVAADAPPAASSSTMRMELELGTATLLRNPNPHQNMVFLEAGESCIFATSGHPILTLTCRGRFLVVHMEGGGFAVKRSRRLYEGMVETALSVVTGGEKGVRRDVKAHVLFGACPEQMMYPLATATEQRVQKYLVDCGADHYLNVKRRVILRGQMSLSVLAATQLYVRGVPLDQIEIGGETFLPPDPKRELVWLGAEPGRNLAIVARQARF